MTQNPEETKYLYVDDAKITRAGLQRLLPELSDKVVVLGDILHAQRNITQSFPSEHEFATCAALSSAMALAWQLSSSRSGAKPFRRPQKNFPRALRSLSGLRPRCSGAALTASAACGRGAASLHKHYHKSSFPRKEIPEYRIRPFPCYWL